MPEYEYLFHGLALVACASPLALFGLLAAAALLDYPLEERSIERHVRTAVVVGLLASICELVLMLLLGTRHVQFTLGNWALLPQAHFHFTFKFVFDRLSTPMVILSFGLCGTISAFASRYMHREAGYRRFFVLLSMFLLGMVVTSLAGTIETLFTGWELVGLSSAMLVAFFHDRSSPVRNALRVWTVYRVADAAFLVAALALHHLSGGGDFVGLMGNGPWPEGHASLTPGQALFVGGLLLVAAAGKSALVPFSGWLPRAMEGPTPSSAVFYGALSVHLGAFLLLRVSPILELSPLLSATVFLMGAITAVHAALSARVQTDIKSALSYASLTQVGIIVAEIGLGFRYLALAHIIGHACLRTLQLLRAPTLLQDYRALENAIGSQLKHDALAWRSWLPPWIEWPIYRLAIHRGYLDPLLDDWIVAPFQKVFRWCDAMERRWTDWLSGRPSRESDRVQALPDPAEPWQ